MGVDPKTVRKWRDRHAAEGEAGLADRSSRPHRSPTRLDHAAEAAIEALRRQRLSGPAIARSSAAALDRRRGAAPAGASAAWPPSTPSRRSIRYERERPGELIHIDIKKLGASTASATASPATAPAEQKRGIGWDHLHVAVDDASRLAYTEILPDERKENATGFLPALAWFAAGVTVERVMTDNGSAYRTCFRRLRAAGLRHIRTRPYTPGPTARPSASSRPPCANGPTPAVHHLSRRAAAMRPWLHDYNTADPTPPSAETSLSRS